MTGRGLVQTVASTASAVHLAVGVFTRRVRDSWSTELTLPERTVLARLDRNGPDTTAGLARWEQISPQAMGVTVATLVARGQVSRVPDPTDGRRQILSITSSGSAVLHAGRDQLTARIADALDQHFTDDEIELIRSAAPLIDRLGHLI